ncbi:hypothetical protein O1611_g9296 [Lasiodiplodia mahajangana]|uniref:Uncharacterized protein n=1 Tax=Lasiodiplodia mahajangana TaxID=1108764 RepID=A0ACC2JAF4_9PEZI|nr:hypothetical protein O1611_g9296 [Lasiodiplodia mahajangana]
MSSLLCETEGASSELETVDSTLHYTTLPYHPRPRYRALPSPPRSTHSYATATVVHSNRSIAFTGNLSSAVGSSPHSPSCLVPSLFLPLSASSTRVPHLRLGSASRFPLLSPELYVTPLNKRAYRLAIPAAPLWPPNLVLGEADTDSVGVVTGEVAVQFFEKTRLDSRILGEVSLLNPRHHRPPRPTDLGKAHADMAARWCRYGK